MAGAIPIIPTDAEYRLIGSPYHVARLLTELDEMGWMAARALLALLADQQQTDNNKRSREIDDDDACTSTG